MYGRVAQALMMWESVIICGKALHFMHLNKDSCPDFLHDSVLALRDLCVVFDPSRRATKSFEGAGVKSLVSMYLPIWHDILDDYKDDRNAKMLVPEPLLCLTERSKITVKVLSPLAQAVRKWIKADLEAVFQKHVTDTKGEIHRARTVSVSWPLFCHAR